MTNSSSLIFNQSNFLSGEINIPGDKSITHRAIILGSLSNTDKESGRPLKFYEAALFQFINPKAWVVALTAATAFFPSGENFIIGTIFVAGTAPFVCFPSICIWALFGSSIKLIIKNTRVKKVIEYLLALLLVVTAVIVVID